METYSHLYPNKQIEVANQLDELILYIGNNMATAVGYKKALQCSHFVATKKQESRKALYFQGFPGLRYT